MNTGAEAVESGIKVARKWGYEVHGVPDDRARIVVVAGDFHGRTTTIVGFSTDPDARGGFGPFTPGFDVVPVRRRRRARGRDDPGHRGACCWSRSRARPGSSCPRPATWPRSGGSATGPACCSIADEMQSGLGRTGHLLATRSAGVDADVYLLGKALGGGIVPLSAVVADEAVLGVLRPGQHGSTFGGNPLACAVGSAVVDLLADPARARPRPVARPGAGGPARRAGRARRRRGAHGGPVGGDRHRPAAGQRPRRVRRRWPAAGCWPRTPTARPCACRRRWWRRPTSSRSPSTPSPRSSPTCADPPPDAHERKSRVHERRTRVQECRTRARRTRVLRCGT